MLGQCTPKNCDAPRMLAPVSAKESIFLTLVIFVFAVSPFSVYAGAIQDAYWEVNGIPISYDHNEMEGTELCMVVAITTGSTITFELWEDDGIWGDDYIDSMTVIGIDDGRSLGCLIPERIEDGVGNPEFYFKATDDFDGQKVTVSETVTLTPYISDLGFYYTNSTFDKGDSFEIGSDTYTKTHENSFAKFMAPGSFSTLPNASAEHVKEQIEDIITVYGLVNAGVSIDFKHIKTSVAQGLASVFFPSPADITKYLINQFFILTRGVLPEGAIFIPEKVYPGALDITVIYKPGGAPVGATTRSASLRFYNEQGDEVYSTPLAILVYTGDQTQVDPLLGTIRYSTGDKKDIVFTTLEPIDVGIPGDAIPPGKYTVRLEEDGDPVANVEIEVLEGPTARPSNLGQIINLSSATPSTNIHFTNLYDLQWRIVGENSLFNTDPYDTWYDTNIVHAGAVLNNQKYSMLGTGYYSGTKVRFLIEFTKCFDGFYLDHRDCEDPQYPDLTVRHPSAQPNIVQPGYDISLSATVKNLGTATASSTYLRYFRSLDPEISTSNLQVGAVPVTSLLPGGDSLKTITVSAPSNPNTYYYGACVDSVGDEVSTDNNCSVSAWVTVQNDTQTGPDLIVASISAQDPVVLIGDRPTLTVQVKNVGTELSASTAVHYYHSTDTIIETGDDEVGSADNISEITPNESKYSLEHFPSPDTPGQHYYGACIEPVDREIEVDNNCSNAVPITILGVPDLVVHSTSVSDHDLQPGQEFFGYATVENQGTGGSESTVLSYYISTDTEIDITDLKGGDDSVSILIPGERKDRTERLNAPTSEGDYWFGACVDNLDNDSNENNNCSVGIPFTVSIPTAPDLLVESIYVSKATVLPEEPFDVSGIVRNMGDRESTPTTLRYLMSDDAVIEGTDNEIGVHGVDRLAPSSEVLMDETVISLGTPGAYWIGACVDSVSGESDTSNQCSNGVHITVSEPETSPDLIVDSVEVSDTMPTTDQSFTVSVTVRNQGDGGSDSATLRYYLSTNSTIDGSDTELSTDPVPALSAGENSPESDAVTVETPGTYWIGACVDSVSGESDTSNQCSDGVQIIVIEDLPVSCSGINVDVTGIDFRPGIHECVVEQNLSVEDSIIFDGAHVTFYSPETHLGKGFLVHDGGYFRVIPPINTSRFLLTDNRYSYKSNYNQACLDEFGETWRQADWLDVLDYYNNGGDLQELVDTTGFADKGNGWVSRNGDNNYNSTRDYFASFHNHSKPSNYDAHDNIDNYFFSLGSWHGTYYVLCYND